MTCQIGIDYRCQTATRSNGRSASLLGALSALWRTWLDRRRARRDFKAYAGLSPRLLRDIGVDPEEAYWALAGPWEEADTIVPVRLLPRTEKI